MASPHGRCASVSPLASKRSARLSKSARSYYRRGASLELYDIPDQPFYVHRVFDLSEESVARYTDRSLEALYWVIEIRSGGEDHDVVRIVSLRDGGFSAAVQAIRAYNASLGKKLDGACALRKFLETFEPRAQQSGWEAGWDAIRARYKLQ